MKYNLQKRLEAGESFEHPLHEVHLLDLDEETLANHLAETLPKVMAEILDPDLAGRSPEAYIRNLRLGRLGDFNQRVVLAVKAEEQVAGLLLALPDKNSEMHIYTVGVLPEHRGKGLGRALVADFLRRAYQGGWGKVVLDVHADNTPALELYNKLGFGIVEGS